MVIQQRAVAVTAAGALVAGSLTFPTTARADYEYTPIPQSQMRVVEVDSVETGISNKNGPAELVLDGNKDTFWHTKWINGVDPLPHHLTIKLADDPVALGRVRLTPRQSSSGSGRVHEYELWTASGDCSTAEYQRQATGAFPGEVATFAEERIITLPSPVQATCAKVVYLSSWGGASPTEIAKPERVASLAEFNADIATGDAPVPSPSPSAPTGPVEIAVPEGAIEISSGDLKVRLHPAFPQVVDYRLGEDQLAGRFGEALTTLLINETEQRVTVEKPVASGSSASYGLTFPDLPGVSMKAVISVTNDTLRFTLTELVDPQNQVKRVRIPNHDLVTVTDDDPAAQLTAAKISVNRSVSGDVFEPLSKTAAGSVEGSWLIIANNSKLAAAFDSNATEDNTAGGTTAARVNQGNTRFQRQITARDGRKYGSVWSGTWTWLGQAVVKHSGSLGRDADPYVEVKITRDANADAVVDWQDGAIATRDIVTLGHFADRVKNEVVSRIPFNIVSQATHPFLRTLDDTKRISLATDNLAQKVLLKGYQSEGHDAAHPDYAGNYNVRAGGLEDLKTLVDEGKKWNSSFGVHVNATESYSEANAFSEDLLRMPPRAAWGWMNQSYYIDGPKDLATQAVLERFKQFRAEVPENLSWLYLDVYYPYGWEMERLGTELQKMGWGLASEWSDRFPQQSLWSHWSQEESYGGTTNKGYNSQVMRFIYNSTRDAWNPHPILSNSNLVDFEGWTGHNNYNQFIANIWQRNLPVKFLQQSDIVKWEDTRITFANGTVATSDVAAIDGRTIPTNRTFTYDGAVVYENGAYLLPWKDGGSDRLYHYNIGGGSTTWKLTKAWSGQKSLTVYKLTDTGRVKVGDITPSNGSITLNAEDGVAYVLYPSSKVPAAQAPNWGQGGSIADPGFFSGTLDAYTVTGDVSIDYSDRGNYQAKLGAGAAELSQQVKLEAGTYSAWAWVEVEPGKVRPVTFSAKGTGVTPAGYSQGEAGQVRNTIFASNVRNATASDEKKGTFFQRLRVTFTTDGNPVTLAVSAKAGEARVLIDDLRVVKFTPAKDNAATPETVFFEDFEGIDTGYFPFATGITNIGGDARTQLAKRHEPYSQKGWWGLDNSGNVVQGGKLNDNVLTGEWSLMANNERAGEILKTSPGAIPFKAGRKYRLSFDYQTTYADQFIVRIGRDTANGTGFTSSVVSSEKLGQQRDTTKYSAEFTTDTCDSYFLAIDKLPGANKQHNLTIDNIRLEDLGAADEVSCVSAAIDGPTSVRGGQVVKVRTTVTSLASDPLTNIEHDLVVPEGWEAEIIDDGALDIAEGESSVATWVVRIPREVKETSLAFTGTGDLAGRAVQVKAHHAMTVIASNEKYLSDLQDRLVGTPENGWGPVEWDRSNGQTGANDGGPIIIDGVTYPKGIGSHAQSSITFNVAGECSTFKAIVGIDDVQPTRGTVQFVVRGDGKELARTATLTAADKGHEMTVDITGVKELTLVADPTSDGVGNDHADWAMARVACGSATTPAVNPVITAPATAKPGEVVQLKFAGFAPSKISAPAEVRIGRVYQGAVEIGEDGTGTFEITMPQVQMRSSRATASNAPVGVAVRITQWGTGIDETVIIALAAAETPADPATPDTPPSPADPAAPAGPNDPTNTGSGETPADNAGTSDSGTSGPNAGSQSGATDKPANPTGSGAPSAPAGTKPGTGSKNTAKPEVPTVTIRPGLPKTGR